MWKAWNRLWYGTKAAGSCVVLVVAAPAICAQSLTPTHLTDLPPLLQEASGLLRMGSDTWLVLDSGNDHAMYRVSEESGEVLQQVTLSNATNVDWEAISTDGIHVYVADVGNNAGARTDLRVYRFPSTALTNTATSITVDTIRFQYADQVDFTPLPDGTNWDCEALLVMDDSLFLFTKNWVDGRTHLYTLPATPGDHMAVRRDAFDVQGLLTGAALHEGNIALVGHAAGSIAPFVWLLNGYVEHRFFDGQRTRYGLATGPLQMEAIAFVDETTLMLGNEATPDVAPSLWQLRLPTAMPEQVHHGKVLRTYPIPADRHVCIQGIEQRQEVVVHDMSGAAVGRVQVGQHGDIDLPYLIPGKYLIEVLSDGVPFRTTFLVAH